MNIHKQNEIYVVAHREIEQGERPLIESLKQQIRDGKLQELLKGKILRKYIWQAKKEIEHERRKAQ